MPVGELEVEVPGAIIVEGVGVVVGGAAIRLNDKLGLRPGEVHRAPFSVAVDDGRG